MTQKPKRKLKNIDFSDDMSHIALVSKHQGGPANGADYSLVLKNLNNPSPEFIQKMQAIQVTMTVPEFLSRFFMLWEEDVEFLSQLLGYVEPEDETMEAKEDYDKWIEERFQSFSIIKSLHEAKSLPEALSKLTEQDYLDVLTDQAEIEKALKAFTKERQSQVDTSTKVESKVEASASKVTKNKKEKQMATPEMVEKSELVALQKSMDDQRVALEKALADVKRYEEEKKEAIVKSKTDAVKAVVKDEKQAAVVVKAALALEDQADFDALVEVFKSMNALIEKSALFQEQGVSAEADETPKKNGVLEIIKSQQAKK